MTNMAAMPIYDENFKHSSPLENADDLESWYAASGTQALSWVVLDLFYGTIKFGPLCFCMGKSKSMYFSENIVVYDIKVGRCCQLNEYMNLY